MLLFRLRLFKGAFIGPFELGPPVSPVGPFCPVCPVCGPGGPFVGLGPFVFSVFTTGLFPVCALAVLFA